MQGNDQALSRLSSSCVCVQWLPDGMAPNGPNCTMGALCSHSPVQGRLTCVSLISLRQASCQTPVWTCRECVGMAKAGSMHQPGKFDGRDAYLVLAAATLVLPLLLLLRRARGGWGVHATLGAAVCLCPCMDAVRLTPRKAGRYQFCPHVQAHMCMLGGPCSLVVSVAWRPHPAAAAAGRITC